MQVPLPVQWEEGVEGEDRGGTWKWTHSLLAFSPACQPQTRMTTYVHSLLGPPLLHVLCSEMGVFCEQGTGVGVRGRDRWALASVKSKVDLNSGGLLHVRGPQRGVGYCPRKAIGKHPSTQSCIGEAVWTVERLIIGKPQAAPWLDRGLGVHIWVYGGVVLPQNCLPQQFCS